MKTADKKIENIKRIKVRKGEDGEKNILSAT